MISELHIGGFEVRVIMFFMHFFHDLGLVFNIGFHVHGSALRRCGPTAHWVDDDGAVNGRASGR